MAGRWELISGDHSGSGKEKAKQNDKKRERKKRRKENERDENIGGEPSAQIFQSLLHERGTSADYSATLHAGERKLN